MKYMVMECHPGYAVVLDENGQFSKVANMRYEVGQTVTDVVPVQISPPQAAPAKKRNVRWLYPLVAAAACLVLVFTFFLPGQPYASVYMTINPEVRIDVDKNDVVVGLEGVNADGVTLIDGYDYKKKNLDLVVDELVDRAIEMGFLFDGGKVTLTLDAEDNEWVVSHTDSLGTHLNEHLEDKITVTVEVCDKHDHSVTIPIDDDDDDDDDDDHDDQDDHDDGHDDDHDIDDKDDIDDTDDSDDINDTDDSDDNDNTDDSDDFDDAGDPDDLDDSDSTDDADDSDNTDDADDADDSDDSSDDNDSDDSDDDPEE